MSKRNDHANLQEGVRELLYQTLETALCGAAIYAAALECAGRTALRDEWTKRHAQTQVHQQVLLSVFEALGLDPMAQTRGRTAVSACCRALFEVVAYARRSKEPAMAQLIAAECVMLAEAKDRQNWALIGFAADALSGAVAKVLKDAYASIWADEARHLYHAKGWARELWIESMGFEPMLPPPEERETAEFASAGAMATQRHGPLMMTASATAAGWSRSRWEPWVAIRAAHGPARGRASQPRGCAAAALRTLDLAGSGGPAARGSRHAAEAGPVICAQRWLVNGARPGPAKPNRESHFLDQKWISVL